MLFMWDDLLDVPDSRLVDDERGAEDIQRVMMGVLTGSEGGVEVRDFGCG